jgi:hypothetical protein
LTGESSETQATANNSPSKKNIANSPHTHNLLSKQITIIPIQSIQKDQNSPIDSNEEDESDDSTEEYSVQHGNTMSETLRLPNG